MSATLPTASHWFREFVSNHPNKRNKKEPGREHNRCSNIQGLVWSDQKAANFDKEWSG
jgi:hypothetical protein